MKIVISNDHAAIPFKEEILSHLYERDNVEVVDLGASIKSDMEYPDYALETAKKVAAGEFDVGILLCGTGVGMSIAANKVCGIRAVVCSDPYSAKLSRQHNNANILCIGARVVGAELGKTIVDAFINATFEGGRHQLRVEKIMAIEKNR
ncbi:MAG: ribose 5-phosphate isomerase B [Defluviitaleaceae bacterium]|nr:ribose 5-phosphate isomerase B [Defluviitaleaceae bacterium]